MGPENNRITGIKTTTLQEVTHGDNRPAPPPLKGPITLFHFYDILPRKLARHFHPWELVEASMEVIHFHIDVTIFTTSMEIRFHGSSASFLGSTCKLPQSYDNTAMRDIESLPPPSH